MPVHELLDSLSNEVASLERAAEGDGKVSFADRTRFERLLYLVLKEYCARTLDYQNLGGLAEAHKRRLLEGIPSAMCSEDVFLIAMVGFEIYSEMHEYCTAHIYCQVGASAKLGGDGVRFLRQAAGKTRGFIQSVREEL